LCACFSISTPASANAGSVPVAAPALDFAKPGSEHLSLTALIYHDRQAPTLRTDPPPIASDDGLIEQSLLNRHTIEARHIANGINTVKMDGFKLCRCHEAILHRRTPEVQRLFGINPTASIHNCDRFLERRSNRSGC
jgi:hypothetical protein